MTMTCPGHGRPLAAAIRRVLAGAAAAAALGLAACGSTVTPGAAGSPAATPSGPAAGPNAGDSGAGSGASGGLNAGGANASASGKAGAASPQTSGSTLLCRQIPSLDRVVITHMNGLKTSQMREVMPLGVMVLRPAVVRALASALCALPPMPPMLHCPASFGAAYRLFFASGGRAYPLINVETTGCRAVTGLGPARWWTRSPGFWPALRQALDSGHALLPARQASSVPTP
jgi:hypothetical protein